MSDSKVGLVLSGGGAKGAYQVGVLKALQAKNVQIDAISGASIGALNGAVLASAPSLEEGVRRLEEVWQMLAENPPLQAHVPSYLRLLLNAGLALNGMTQLLKWSGKARILLPMLLRTASHAKLLEKLGERLPILQEWLKKAAPDVQQGLLSNDPLHDLMDQYLDLDSLNKGLPLYISAFPSMGGEVDIGQCIMAELGLSDTQDSRYFHLQSIARDKQRQMLLASAALPMLFAPQEYEGVLYTDGGQGGWQKSQGNTPIRPLIDAGCKSVVVTHLSDGSLWSRSDFPEATILEIRPRRSLARAEGFGGGARDLLGFGADNVASWVEQGYEDTMACVGRVKDALDARASLRNSESMLQASEKRVHSAEASMREAMKRLSES